MARLDAAAIARAVGRLQAAVDEDPERFAPLELVLEDWPGEGYDPDETPEARRADR